jgi:hypothetical protein
LEAWQVIFRNLYTGFLLRDFCGKIVPGVFLLFSICTIYRDPRRLLQNITKELPIFTLILLAGFAWIITLGTQSFAEGLGIWSYFPSVDVTSPAQVHKIGMLRNLLGAGDDSDFDKDTLKVVEFQVNATEDQKQQYERYVVIKEACGNLFVAGLFSLPAWLYGFYVRNEVLRHRLNAKFRFLNRIPEGSLTLSILYVLLVMVGLHRMHEQHVHRQLQYANDLIERHVIESRTHPGSSQPSPQLLQK